MAEVQSSTTTTPTTPTTTSGKPSVIILGGCGFIGRNFVKYLIDNNLTSKIRVVDKSRPETSYFNPIHKAAFDNKEQVEYMQADITKDASVDKVFNGAFDFVFNLCGETRFSLSEQDYKSKCLDTAVKCAAAAAKIKVKKFVEVSTGQVYEPNTKKSAEDAKLAPWTVQASYRLKAENELAKIQGLPLVVLRPAIVYGPADLTGLSPRIVVAAAYKHSGKTMKFLWGEQLRLNVVHVFDVCRALWIAATELKPGTTYNLADPVDLSQGKLNEWLGTIFKVKTDFFGSVLSNIAKVALSSVADDANHEHVPQWQALCQEYKIQNTPLSPYIDKELLYNNSLCLDGEKIIKDSSFKGYISISQDQIKEQIDFFIKQNLFPPCLSTS